MVVNSRVIFDYGYKRISSQGPSSSADWEVPAAAVHARHSKRYLNNKAFFSCYYHVILMENINFISQSSLRRHLSDKGEMSLPSRS